MRKVAHRMMRIPLHIPHLVIILMLFVTATWSQARTIHDDPLGFYGITWGHSLKHHPRLIQIDREGQIVFYRLKNTNPQAWGIPVESIKFLTLDDQFAQALIHYQGETTHQALLNYLETTHGKTTLSPGSMMRGLNQQYSWRGDTTEISLTYRGLNERGFISVQSRILAAGLMNAVSDQSF